MNDIINIYNHTFYFSITKKYLPLFLNIYEVTNKLIKSKSKKVVDINFVTKKEIKKINNSYRNKNKVTDVISFAFDESDASSIYLGELYICYSVAKQQAKKYNHKLEREIAFLFVHGLLHLYGYDHINQSDEKIMFNLQEKILKECKIYR